MFSSRLLQIYVLLDSSPLAQDTTCCKTAVPSSLFCRPLLFLQEVLVQLPELFQEAPVGDDPPALFHMLNGIHHRHVLTDHEVCEEERGGAAPSHHAVHQQFIWREITSRVTSSESPHMVSTLKAVLLWGLLSVSRIKWAAGKKYWLRSKVATSSATTP